MYVQCPSCETTFRVTTRDLTHADGLVRCGQCLEIFNGLDRLRALQPNSDGAPPDSEPIDSDAPASEERDAPPLELELEEVVLEESAPLHPDESLDESGPAEPDSFIEPELAPAIEPPGRHGRTLIWGLVNVVLILALGLQYVYAERRELYRYPELQPWLGRFCGLTGCDLPPRRDTSRIELLNRNVYSHPNIGDALMITATLVNTAPHPQPFPLVELSLSDLQGQVVAMRRFRPREYLSDRNMGDQPMEPGVPTALTLEIRDPGSHALAFEFDFL